jgi:hypothetical protein
LIWGYPTIGALAPFLIEKMGLSGAVAAEAQGAAEEPIPFSPVAQLSEDAAEALLSEKLAGLEAEYQ